MVRNIFLTLMAGAALAPASANACAIYTPSADLSVFHEQIPKDVPREALIADVEFEHSQLNWRGLAAGARARIKRVVQGDYKGAEIIVRDDAEIRITCYDPFRGKASGIIIGKPKGDERGVLVVAPIFASAEDRLRAKEAR